VRTKLRIINPNVMFKCSNLLKLNSYISQLAEPLPDSRFKTDARLRQ